MANREEMLSTIRNILKTQEKAVPGASSNRLPPPLENVMSPIPPEELSDRFEAELKRLDCHTYRAVTLAELDDILRSILEATQARSVVFSKNPILGQLQVAEKIGGWGKKVTMWPTNASAQTDSRTFREECFTADAGITGADFALAETGSLILTSLSEGCQLSSLAPPVHVVLYRRSQIRASLEEVLKYLPVSLDPEHPSPARSIVFVTGPSRTADIEQVLVRGVHGPREVHAILVEDSCLSG